MKKTPSSYSFKIPALDADANNQLKISAIFNYMQVVAGLNANELGFGYDQLVPKGYFWMLLRVILEWHGKAGIGDEIIVETWPKGIDKLFALRDFKFYSQNRNCIGKATSAWLMIDIRNRKPIMLNNSIFHLPNYDIPAAIDEFPEKISEPSEKILLGTRKAAYSDLDINQHVNNAKYLEYIFDALPTQDFTPFQNCRLQINYLKELKLGESFVISYAQSDASTNNYYVDAVNANKQKVFQSMLAFEPA